MSMLLEIQGVRGGMGIAHDMIPPPKESMVLTATALLMTPWCFVYNSIFVAWLVLWHTSEYMCLCRLCIAMGCNCIL